MIHVLAAIAAIAGPAPQASPAPPAPAEAEKKVCRRTDTTGSIMFKKVCHTRAEWAVADAATRRAAEDALTARGPTRTGSN